MVDPMHFDRRAVDYARSRPAYPAALWATLRQRGLLTPGARALDLGAGTGQATGPLVAAGLRVTAVEPGPRLAELLHAGHPAADVVPARAEDLAIEPGSFDLVVAATAIHWMDPHVVLPLVHRALGPDGRFVVMRHVFGDPSVETPFRAAVADIVTRRRTPPRAGPDAEDVAVTSAGLTRSGLFAAEHRSVFRYSIELDVTGVRRLFGTFSDWSPDEVETAARAVGRLGGRVREHYRSWLIVLRPRPQESA